MRRWLWTLGVLGCFVFLLIGGCAEDKKTEPEVDTVGPSVQLVYPPNIVGDEWVVSDSVDIYIAAADNDRVTEATAFFTRPGETQRRVVGTTESSVPIEAVPDSVLEVIRIPEGHELYKLHWKSNVVTSGSRPQLFASAGDPSGNRGQSEVTTVLILNEGDDLVPPIPGFLVTPPEGTVVDEFTFDAVGSDPDNPLTNDRIVSSDQVTVRWDFNGDDNWDIDWDAEARASDLQTWTYDIPSIYNVRMQARNDYIDDLSPVANFGLSVKPVGGNPRPPASMAGEFSTLPAGIYTRGAVNPLGATKNEFPVHNVNLTFDVFILSREVTNAEYLEFVRVALDSAWVTFADGKVRRNDIHPPADSTWLYLDIENSRLFFDPDEDDLFIQSGYGDHPITGVTWYGANAFAFSYGLRLPTEAEWEAGSRYTNSEWRYSFGDSITVGDPSGMARVNYVESGDPFEGNNGTTPVKYYDGSNHGGFQTIDTRSDVVGLYDVSGNVAEWCLDWYALYPLVPIVINPQGPVEGQFKVVRGGSYLSSAEGVRVTRRDGDKKPDTSFPSIGFRVAFIDFGDGLQPGLDPYSR